MKLFGHFIAFVFIVLIPLFLSGQQENKEPLIQKINDHHYVLSDMTIDTERQTVSIPCTVNMSSGLIEVILCRPEGKVHESMLTTMVTPLEFQTALLLLGLDPVNEIPDDPDYRSEKGPYKNMETPGDSVRLFLETHNSGIKDIEIFIYNEKSKSVLDNSTWLFRGAVTMIDDMIVLDPEVSMIATYHDAFALMELNSPTKFNDELYYVNKAAGLKVKDSVNLIIQKLN